MSNTKSEQIPGVTASRISSATSIEEFLLAQLAQDTASSEQVMGSTLSYHEMADVPVRRVELLEQMETNLEQLRDVTKRLRFMNREIRYLLRA